MDSTASDRLRSISHMTEEYYNSLQMGLPPLYYSGRENPPHLEIWVNYFLRMVELYSTKVREISKESAEGSLYESLSHLNSKEKEMLLLLLQRHLYEYTPIEVSKVNGVTNKTVINRSVKLAANGFVTPIIVKKGFVPISSANMQLLMKIPF